MRSPSPSELRDALKELIAESLDGPLPVATPRRVLGPLQLPGKATAVIGMRRAGKTTFLHQIRREKLAAGVRREQLPYLNFEDERLVALTVDRLQWIDEEYQRLAPELPAGERVVWFFDEIQRVAGWERFVRRMLDAGRSEIYLSGSSAALLSRELATAMRGRGWKVLLHPFSFAEYLAHHGNEMPSAPTTLTSRRRLALERAFLDYLSSGGFPEVQGLEPSSRHRLLQDYVDVAMLRDVVERHAVSQVAGLRWLVRHLLGNAAGLFSVEKFYGALKSQGFSISKDTVHQLVGYLDDCFLVRTVWVESESERRRMVNPRKVYPVDPGLIPVFDPSGRANVGHALETVVLLELERRGAELTYVRTRSGREVDFLARFPGGKPQLIQVSADLSDPAVEAREFAALQEAGSLFPQARKRLLTLRREGPGESWPDDIEVEPVAQWALRPES